LAAHAAIVSLEFKSELMELVFKKKQTIGQKRNIDGIDFSILTTKNTAVVR